MLITKTNRNTMKHKFLMGFLLLMMFNSCSYRPISRILFERHTVRKINLHGFKDSICVIYDMDSARIIIGRNEILKYLNRLNLKADNQTLKTYHKTINLLSQTDSNITIRYWRNMMNFKNLDTFSISGFIDQYLLRNLIKKGQIEVFNKSDSEYEKVIYIHHDKFVKGGELNESYSYSFRKSGKDFLDQIY